MPEKITAKNFKKEVNSFEFSEKVEKQRTKALSVITKRGPEYKHIALQMMYLSGRYFEKGIVDDPRKYNPTDKDVQKWLKIYGGDKYLSKIVTFGKKEKIKEFTKEKIKFNKKEVDADLLKVYPNLYDKSSFGEAFDSAQYPNKQAGKYYDALKDVSVDVLTNNGLQVVNSWLKDHGNAVPQWKKAILARKEVTEEEKEAAEWEAIKKFTKFEKKHDLYMIGNGKADIAPSGADFHALTNAKIVDVTDKEYNMDRIEWNKGKKAYYYVDGKKRGKRFYLKHKGEYILFPIPEVKVKTKTKTKPKTEDEAVDNYFKKTAEGKKAKEKMEKLEKAELLKPVDDFLNRVAEAEVWMSKVQKEYKLDSNFSSNKAEYLTKLKGFLVLEPSGKTFEDFVNEGGHNGYKGKENLETYYSICEEISGSQLKKLKLFKNALILFALGVGINESASVSAQKAQLAEAVKKVPEIKMVDEKIKDLEKGFSK